MCLTGTRKRIIRIATFGIRKAMNPDNMRPDRTQAAVPAVLSARPDSLTVPRAASAFHCRPFLGPPSSANHSRLPPPASSLACPAARHTSVPSVRSCSISRPHPTSCIQPAFSRRAPKDGAKLDLYRQFTAAFVSVSVYLRQIALEKVFW